MMELSRLLAHNSQTIRDVMKLIDDTGLGIAIIVDDRNKFVGLVTDGDIRRAILQGARLDNPVGGVANTNPIVLQWDQIARIEHVVSDERVAKKVPLFGALKIPILNEHNDVIDILIYSADHTSTYLLGEKQFREKPVKKVSVIGGAGYLGSVLVRVLLNRGYFVRVLDNFMYGDHGVRGLYDKERFEFTRGDIRNISDVTNCVKDVDAVIHLAAIVGDTASQRRPEETIEINYLATKSIAEICKYLQVNRFLFASTCSVYGSSPFNSVSITEESPVNPLSLYAEMKLKSEQAILEIADTNFRPTILRMGTLYGLSPRMRFDLVVNLFVAQALKDNIITIFGGEQWRPFVHLEDAAEAFVRCLEARIDQVGGKTFNVGSNEQNYTITALGEMIERHAPGLLIERKTTLGDARNYRVDFSRIAELGFRPRKTIQDGISEIERAFKEGIIADYRDKMYSNVLF